MENLVKKCINIIENSTWRDMTNYEGYNIEFKENGKRYELKFNRLFFFYHYVRIFNWTDCMEIVDQKVSREEYNKLKRSFKDRYKELKDIEMENILPGHVRDEKLSELLD